MKRLITMILALAIVIAAVACSTNTPSDAEQNGAWPMKQITVIVPWKSGGGADTSARLFCKYWAKELGVDIIIENREGGDGVVGTTYYEGLTQDANTVLFTAQPFFSSMILSGNVSFGEDNFSPIGIYETDPSCIAVMPSSGWTTIEDLDAAIKAAPGEIRIGVNGGSTHLILAKLLIEKYDWDVKLVYYSGASESRTALMGGHVEAIATTTSGCTEEFPLIVGSLERNARYPDSPTYAEITGDSQVFATTRMFLVDKTVTENYPERYQKLVETFEKVFDNPEYQTDLIAAGRDSTTAFQSVEVSSQVIAAQHDLSEKYWDILNAAG